MAIHNNMTNSSVPVGSSWIAKLHACPNSERNALVALKTHCCGMFAIRPPGLIACVVKTPIPPPTFSDGRNERCGCVEPKESSQDKRGEMELAFLFLFMAAIWDSGDTWTTITVLLYFSRVQQCEGAWCTSTVCIKIVHSTVASSWFAGWRIRKFYWSLVTSQGFGSFTGIGESSKYSHNAQR